MKRRGNDCLHDLIVIGHKAEWFYTKTGDLG